MSAKQRILVTIAARGGSKGIKNKNIRPLLGKPLIAYSILQAKAWDKAENIVCSTDSEAIAASARKYGAEVPFLRPARLSGDSVSKVQVISHALRECEERYNQVYDIVVDLDATAPIRTTLDLDNCLFLFRKLQPKVLFSVVKSHKNPYFNMVEEKADGFVRLCKDSGKVIIKRQKTPAVYSMNASIYFYSRDFLLDKRNLTPFSDKSAIYLMDDDSSFDIDREIDFKIVELLMKERMRLK
jgi:CMP-N,N'-diacetyllegionaminic acid synthase